MVWVGCHERVIRTPQSEPNSSVLAVGGHVGGYYRLSPLGGFSRLADLPSVFRADLNAWLGLALSHTARRLLSQNTGLSSKEIAR